MRGNVVPASAKLVSLVWRLFLAWLDGSREHPCNPDETCRRQGRRLVASGGRVGIGRVAIRWKFSREGV